MLALSSVVLGALVALVAWAAPARATVVFSSTRCADEADLQARPDSLNAISARKGCTAAIWRVEDDGSGLRRLPGSGEDGRHDGDPDVARDGSVVAVRRGQVDGRSAFVEPNRIWLMPLAGGAAVPVSPPADSDQVQDTQPALSPDAREVAFARSEGGGAPHDLWVATLGGAARRLTATPADEQHPVFSPDGRKIAFVIPYGFRSEQLLWATGVYVMDADGTDVAPLVAGTLFPSPVGLDWAPDGSAITLVNGTLDVIALDGGRVRLPGVPGISPVFGAGARSLFYSGVSERDRGMGLWRLDLADGVTRELVGPEVAAPDWVGPANPVGAVVDRLGPVIDIAPPQPTPESLRLPVARAAQARPKRLIGSEGTTRVPFRAADRSGVRRVQAAIGRRVGRRCRFATLTGYSRPRSCGKPRWTTLRDLDQWHRATSSLPRGRYVVSLRATDTLRNTTRRPATVKLTVR